MTASSSGRALFGVASSATGTNFAVRGHTSSADGYSAYFTGGRNFFQGNVGVGTANPLYPVHAQSSNTANGSRVLSGQSSGLFGQTYGVYGSVSSNSGTAVHGQAVANNGENIAVSGHTNSPQGFSAHFTGVDGSVSYFERSVGIGTDQPQAMLEVDAPANDIPFEIRSGQTHHMRVHPNGGVAIGGAGFSGVPSQGLRVFGNVGIGVVAQHQLHLSLNSAAKPTSNTWTISSDARLKNNINTIEHALDDLLALRGVTYQWIDPSTQGDMDGVYTGFIAQEVEEVFPEWISEDAEGFKKLTVIGFEGIVVEALRELRAEKNREIGQLRESNAMLESRVNQLEQDVQRLMAALKGRDR